MKILGQTDVQLLVGKVLVALRAMGNDPMTYLLVEELLLLPDSEAVSVVELLSKPRAFLVPR